MLLVTNDVDEALLLADRVLILNPDGTLGPEFEVDLPRPRDRMALNDDPVFKALRAEITQYLLDVGIAAKAPRPCRQLPDVTPRHRAAARPTPRRRRAVADEPLPASSRSSTRSIRRRRVR